MVVEQMDWTRKPQPVGQMNAAPTLVADGVQVGEWHAVSETSEP